MYLYVIAFGLLIVGWLLIFFQVIHVLPYSLVLSFLGHCLSFVGVILGLIAVFSGREREY